MNYKELKKLRMEKKYSLLEMAECIGLQTAGGYLRIENGENKLKAEHLPLLAKKFDMSLEELITRLFFEKKVDESSTFNLQPA
ncbi:helix-turn-helix domain-containing protein [Brevibacillus sp. SIMBA_040]|uniref:helix-turn-helix domain-containing protein n=1 Tax=unclassified Brevibacillus TaxID=2684853 RepID=UPI00397D5ABE